ncbi:MAG: hypothetical protein M1840_005624 [Geoglossum simile]|nr:MAG: hypothetical protein M1840_005624 [Geoglossum simile]
MRTDPRIRQTWNQLSQNLESANESAQANLWTFSQYYLAPCIASLGACVRSCAEPCFPVRDERLRRSRGRVRGRAENSFDFYDDWDDENDASGGILGWENDELDRLLAGSNTYGGTAGDGQPGRQRTMSYGARRGDRISGARRKSAVPPHDGGPDPTIIPNTSAFGFLGRLPWKIGGKGLRYKPSAADLQEHPGARRTIEETEPLVEDAEEEEWAASGQKQNRKRSNTTNSGSTADSFRSRGDLFPSEDEDDAVPLDDEFATTLEQQRRHHSTDEISGKTTGGFGKRPSISRKASSRTASSNHTSGKKRRPRGSSSVSATSPRSDTAMEDSLSPPSMTDLRREEELVQKEEEQEVERRREAAHKLALRRGLTVDEGTVEEAQSSEPESKLHEEETPSLSPTILILPNPLTQSPTSDAPPPIQPQDQPQFTPARLPQLSPPTPDPEPP